MSADFEFFSVHTYRTYTSQIQDASEIMWSDVRFSPAQWNFEFLVPSPTDLLSFTLQVLRWLFHKVYLGWIVVFNRRDCKGSIYSSFSRTGIPKFNHLKGMLKRRQRDDRSRVSDKMWQWYTVGFDSVRTDHRQTIGRPLEAGNGKKRDPLLEPLEGFSPVDFSVRKLILCFWFLELIVQVEHIHEGIWDQEFEE